MDGGKPLLSTYWLMKSRMACCRCVSAPALYPNKCTVVKRKISRLLVACSVTNVGVGGFVRNDHGVALILALLVLSFLTVLGGALLTASTIDIWISDNYKTATQSVYLAEAGIEDARELLRVTGRTPSELLNV